MGRARYSPLAEPDSSGAFTRFSFFQIAGVVVLFGLLGWALLIQSKDDPVAIGGQRMPALVSRVLDYNGVIFSQDVYNEVEVGVTDAKAIDVARNDAPRGYEPKVYRGLVHPAGRAERLALAVHWQPRGRAPGRLAVLLDQGARIGPDLEDVVVFVSAVTGERIMAVRLADYASGSTTQ